MDVSYYDGKTARRQAASIRFEGSCLSIAIGDWTRHDLIAGVVVSERLENAPRTITFKDGAYCEIPDTDELRRALASAGIAPGAVERWQFSTNSVIWALALLLGLAFAGYRYGIPLIARIAAARVPDTMNQTFADHTLMVADGSLFEPSTLSRAKQAALIIQFQQLRKKASADDVVPSLLFRSSPRVGPNAFALPDGRIVLTDELVRLADDDDQIMAVLGHELGHIHHHHVMRQIFQQSALGAAMFAWVGDASALIAMIPIAALEARYSREFESEADAYAATFLKANGLSPALLIQMLDNLEVSIKGLHAEKVDDDQIGSYLASHPPSKERIEALRRAQ